MTTRTRRSLFFDDDQWELLAAIAQASRGSPPIAHLVREAVNQYVLEALQDEELRDRVSRIRHSGSRVIAMPARQDKN